MEGHRVEIIAAQVKVILFEVAILFPLSGLFDLKGIVNANIDALLNVLT